MRYTGNILYKGDRGPDRHWRRDTHDKPAALINRFVRLDRDSYGFWWFETYYQPDTFYSGWDSTSKIGLTALLNEYDSSGDIKGTPARWNRTPQNWVVYREYRVDGIGAGGFLGRSEVGVEEGLYSVTGRDTYKLTAAGSRYHQDHDLAWSDSGYNDFTRGFRYPRQLYYYPFYNGENQASFYREGPHPGRWTYVFWGPDSVVRVHQRRDFSISVGRRPCVRLQQCHGRCGQILQLVHPVWFATRMFKKHSTQHDIVDSITSHSRTLLQQV